MRVTISVFTVSLLTPANAQWSNLGFHKDITSTVFELQKWFLHQNGIEFNLKSKSWLVQNALTQAQKLALIGLIAQNISRACREGGVVLILGDGTMEQWWDLLNLLNNIFLKLYLQRRTAGYWKQNFSFCWITCLHWRSRSRVRKWSATAEADQSHFLNI